MNVDDSTPIVVGVGQVTHLEADPQAPCSPTEIMAQAVECAVSDAGLEPGRLNAVFDRLIAVDTMRRSRYNLPVAIAERLGFDVAVCALAPVSGHVPQVIVNHLCADIGAGRMTAAVITGGEVLNTERQLKKSGHRVSWTGPEGTPKQVFARKPFASEHERNHGIWLATDTYPIFESALMRHYGRNVDEHMAQIGRMWSKFSRVAADNPHAWFRKEWSSEQVLATDNGNRLVSWPYTRCMNAMNQVDQSAAVLIMSVAKARELGIDESQWVYLHGCAQVDERGFVSERVNYHSSPGIRVMAEAALEMAGRTVADIDLFDLYSCFPSAVQIARDEIGIGQTDTRPLTVTGGLAFNGGAGSSYVLNAVAAMVERLRAAPGTFGMVTANGGLLSEHAVGIYSTTPASNLESGRNWSIPEGDLQAEVDACPAPEVDRAPSGKGAIEAYTVVHDRDGFARRGIVIGRSLEKDNVRFIANTPVDPDLFEAMERDCLVGAEGRVSNYDGFNTFQPI